jgi:hypothetical protein
VDEKSDGVEDSHLSPYGDPDNQATSGGWY